MTLEDIMADDQILQLSLERSVNASQLHSCKVGYCLKSVRKRVNQKEAAKKLDAKGDSKPDPKEKEKPTQAKGLDAILAADPVLQKAAANIDDKGKENETPDAKDAKKPQWETKYQCRFEYPKDFEGFDAKYITDDTGQQFLDAVVRAYHADKTPVKKDGAWVNEEKAKVCSIRSHPRLNRNIPEVCKCFQLIFNISNIFTLNENFYFFLLVLVWNANVDCTIIGKFAVFPSKSFLSPKFIF